MIKELLYFKLVDCPYCVQADRWIDELRIENPEYQKIEMRIVNEKIESEFANKYNYYYVPTFFYDNYKLHEGVANKEKIKLVLDYVLERIDE